MSESSSRSKEKEKELQNQEAEGNGGAASLKKGPWTSAEDAILVDYVKKHGEGNWNAVQKHSGLSRCGKSCRLRWANHLRPNLKKGAFTPEEEQLIIELHAKLGNKWARMASQLPGRTDNEIKNYWNTRIKRRQRQGLPLYPPDLHLQHPGDNQQNQQPNISETDNAIKGNRPHDYFCGSSKLDIPHVSFDAIKPGHHPLTYPSSVPALSEVSMNSILNQALGYSQGYRMINPSIQRFKRVRETEPVISPPFAATRMTSFGEYLNGTAPGKMLGEPCFKSVRISPFDESGRLEAYTHPSRLDANMASAFSYDANPSIKNPSADNPSSFGASILGSHALLNGTFSASMPLSGVKLELPSSQLAESVQNTGTDTLLETESIAPRAYAMSPTSPPPLNADCFSPHNSGLLEALLHESQAMGGAKKQLSSETVTRIPADLSDCKLNDSAMPSSLDTVCEEYNDPITPLGGPAASVFSENTPPLSSGPWEESSSVHSASGINPSSAEHNEFISNANCGDEELSNILNLARLDVPPISDWYSSQNDVEKEQSTVNDAFATLFSDDFGPDLQNLTSGSSISKQTWGLGSCHWNNMPGATQISENP